MPELASLTAADIARLAGVTRATVSNWRRRHPDFPAPSGGTDASPAYDRAEVEAWLASRGALPELPPEERLWHAVLEAATETDLGSAAAGMATALSGSAPHPQSAGDGGLHARVVAAAAGAIAEIGPERAIESLTGKYAEATGVMATPAPLAALMADLADPGKGVVLDPACGTGETLAAVLERGTATACGQELDDAMAALAEFRLRSRRWQAEVAVCGGDSLTEDAYGGLQADAVVCHPPFASRDWPQEALAGDRALGVRHPAEGRVGTGLGSARARSPAARRPGRHADAASRGIQAVRPADQDGVPAPRRAPRRSVPAARRGKAEPHPAPAVDPGTTAGARAVGPARPARRSRGSARRGSGRDESRLAAGPGQPCSKPGALSAAERQSRAAAGLAMTGLARGGSCGPSTCSTRLST